MSAHILFNLLNKLRKSDKMQGLPSISSLFRNEFNKFSNTGAQMLDSIYHVTLKLLLNHLFFCAIMQRFAIYTRRYYGCQYIILPKICKPLVVYRF